MFKKLLYFLGLIICVGCGKPETTQEEKINLLLKEFNELVSVEKEEFLGKTYATWHLDTIQTEKSSFPWLRENAQMVNYYLRNGLVLDTMVMRDQMLPFDTKEQEVRSAILADRTLGNWLERIKSSDKVKQAEEPMWTVSSDSLLDIASRFFYMTDWNPHLVQMGFRFCEGINGHDRNAPNEQKLIAAFCFQTLRNNMGSTQSAASDFYNESSMRSFRKLAEDYPDSVDAAVMEDQLLTLRQEFYDLVSRDSSVREVIFRTYEEQKEILPFALAQ